MVQFRDVLGEKYGGRPVFLAYYDSCWRTHDVVNQRTGLPAAMEAGVVDTPWSFEELSDRVMGNGRAAAA